MRWPRPPAPPGIVLFATIIFVVVAGLAMATAVYLGAQAVVVARARADAVRARLAAASAVRAGLAAWPTGALRVLPLLAETAVAGPLVFPGPADGSATVRRLGGDAYLVLGVGRAGVASARATALVHLLPVRSFLSLFPAAVTTSGGRLANTARVAAPSPAASPASWSGDACGQAMQDTLAAVFGAAPRPGLLAPSGAVEVAGAELEGDPPFAEASPGVPPDGLGPIGWARLAEWADRLESGTLTIAPVAGDAGCERQAPANWGAPLDAFSPCATYFPLIYAPGDLRLIGGAGQGVLVVRGDLLVDGDTRFLGAVLVGGTARLGAGTQLRGALRAGALDSAGDIEYSACALSRALSEAPGLGRPVRMGSRLWLPAF